ncbi:MAG TPA: ABC transporter permease [Acidimicrobiales bacterium]|nr:ABC transporter permease [Acidimicrobiales bacterium]
MTAPLATDDAVVAAETGVAARAVHLPGAAWVGIGLVGSFVLVALLAPVVAPYRTAELAGRPLEPPSTRHLLGTNGVGQDVLSQMLSGARASLFVAAVAGLGTLVLGALVGLVGGWWRGFVDAVLMRVVDVLIVIPRLPLLIVAGAYVGPGLLPVAVIIALTFWPSTARVVRSQVLSVRRRDHVTAATGFGAGTVHVLRRHVLPAVGLVLAAELVTAAGRAVVLETGLAFLGLGDPSVTSWGSVMRDAFAFGGLFYTRAWAWWLLPPVLAVTLLLVGVTFLGVAVEQRVNPRLARHTGGRR